MNVPEQLQNILTQIYRNLKSFPQQFSQTVAFDSPLTVDYYILMNTF